MKYEVSPSHEVEEAKSRRRAKEQRKAGKRPAREALEQGGGGEGGGGLEGRESGETAGVGRETRAAGAEAGGEEEGSGRGALARGKRRRGRWRGRRALLNGASFGTAEYGLGNWVTVERFLSEVPERYFGHPWSPKPELYDPTLE